MNENESKKSSAPQEFGKATLRRRKHVAQRDKLDAQAQARSQQATQKAATATGKPSRGQEKPRLQASRRAGTTLARAIEDYLQDHAGGNHSDKTLEWHRTALGLLRTYLGKVCGITLVDEIDAPDISGWFAEMRTSPGSRGKPRSERTIQTYARSARAFFHWLVHREILQSNPFERVVLTVKGKGSKERRVALGQNCLRNLLYYLDKQRPDEEELAEWGSTGEDHLFLSETRLPLTKNGVTLLFKRIRQRAGVTNKRISPHIFRHSFAIRYLVLGNDPFSLQELLGHEDMTTVKNYMHMNDETIQAQKRKYSPGDHLPTRMPGPRETRRRSYRPRGHGQKKREE